MKILKGVGLITLLLVIFLGMAVLISILPALIYQVDYIFYSVSDSAFIIAIVTVYVLVGFFLVKYHHTVKKQSGLNFALESELTAAYGLIQPVWHKSKLLIAIVVIACLYVSCTQVVFVASDEIFVVRPLSPLGTSYHYTDVVEVKIYSPIYKSELNYQITLTDGTKVNLNGGGGDDINGDTYESLQDFDYKVVKLGIKKSSDLDAVYRCTKDYDRVYHDRWMNIAQNGLKAD
ncbi:MAG TPA: hypothetical protein DCY20_08450 [Firmicutes bacterium]|nr:hypothetical protein [Bacillota bacterium]